MNIFNVSLNCHMCICHIDHCLYSSALKRLNLYCSDVTQKNNHFSNNIYLLSTWCFPRNLVFTKSNLNRVQRFNTSYKSICIYLALDTVLVSSMGLPVTLKLYVLIYLNKYLRERCKNRLQYQTDYHQRSSVCLFRYHSSKPPSS